jgi:hypothetical protein
MPAISDKKPSVVEHHFSKVKEHHEKEVHQLHTVSPKSYDEKNSDGKIILENFIAIAGKV